MLFDCALADRKFYLPKDGSMKLQFFHVKDLCGLMEVIIKNKPDEHIFMSTSRRYDTQLNTELKRVQKNIESQVFLHSFCLQLAKKML